MLKPLEEFRVKETGRLRRYGIRILASLVIMIVAIVLHSGILIAFLILVILWSLGNSYNIFQKMSDHLTRSFKNHIIPELLEFLFEDFEYILRQRIARSVIEKSMIFPGHVSRVSGEDFMRFRIGDTFIMLCETTAFGYGDKKIFNGIFTVATFNKNFSSRTFVIHRKASAIKQVIRKELLGPYKKVEMEDPEFAGTFTVLSSDQVEARYILTPSFMERLLQYSSKINKPITFSFVENRLHCAIPKFINLFEPALFGAFDFEFIKKSYVPLKLYTELVDDLNLNVRIWTED